MQELFTLYWTFLKIGTFMFGGGYSMLPLLTRELVDKRGWADEEELLDYFAIAQCTPGIIAINTATFIGQKRKGFLGGALATLGVITVPVVLVLVIAATLRNFWEHPMVIHAFNGIRVAVSALIASAVIRLFRSSVKNWFGIAMCIFGFLVVGVLGQSPVIVVMAAALGGLLAGRIRK
ncbi:MAG: chromate transporter [Clostridia bacterium]